MSDRWTSMAADLKARWRALDSADRARRLAIAGLSAAVVGYAALWLPLRRNIARLETVVPRDQQRLETMRTQAAEVLALRGKTVGGRRAGGSSLSAVEQSADQWGIRPQMTSLNQDAANGLQVVLEGVPFNTMVSWLDDLRKKQGLRVDKATVEALSVDGFVTARLALQ